MSVERVPSGQNKQNEILVAKQQDPRTQEPKTQENSVFQCGYGAIYINGQLVLTKDGVITGEKVNK